MNMKEKHQAWGVCGGGGQPRTRTQKEERALFDEDIRLTLKKMEALLAVYPYTKGIIREALECLPSSWLDNHFRWMDRMVSEGHIDKENYEIKRLELYEKFSIRRQLLK